jgi:RNA polymerase sigma factor (sigma-70 family)
MEPKMPKPYVTEYTNPEQQAYFWETVSEQMDNIKKSYYSALRTFPHEDSMDCEAGLNEVIYELYRLDKVHKWDPKKGAMQTYLKHAIYGIVSHLYSDNRKRNDREVLICKINSGYKEGYCEEEILFQKSGEDCYSHNEEYTDLKERLEEKINESEREWLDLTLQGYSNSEISRDRGYSKMTATTRAKAVRKACLELLEEM